MAYPILLRDYSNGLDWFKSTTKTKPDITIIRIVDSYVPIGSETERWNADVGDTGSIECFIKGTELIIAGNGSGKISAPADSSYLFSDAVTSPTNIQTFKNVTHFYGAELLDMSSTTTLKRAFSYMLSLEYIDVSNWDLSNVTSLEYTFGAPNTLVVDGVSHDIGGSKIKKLDVCKWDVSKVTTFKNTFLGCRYLESLDVSRWNTSSARSFQSMLSICENLMEFDVRNFDVGSLKVTTQMFNRCENLRELDFSAWKAPNVVSADAMLFGTYRIEKLKFGRGVTFGDRFYPELPLNEYIEGADGKWHTIRGDSYDLTNMINGVNITYYASPLLVEKVLATPVIISGATALDIANAVREKTGTMDDILPSEVANAIRSIESGGITDGQ